MLEAILRNRVLTLLIVGGGVLVLLGLVAPGFLSANTASLVWSNSAILLLLALGLLPVLLTRNIDVSGGSTLGLSAIALGLALQAGAGLGGAITVALLTGFACGVFNGVLVAGIGVPSIVATLGTLGLYRGLMLIATGGEWIENLPEDLKALAAKDSFGISPLGWTVAAIAVVLALALASHKGQWVSATGDNRVAARHLGLPVRRIEALAFAWSGLCAAGAGIIFAAQIGFIPNQAGTGTELRAIAALVLGGVSLLGGTGSVAGVVVGVLLLTAIDTALVFLRVPAYWNDVIGGAVLLGVLLLDGRLRLVLAARDRAARLRRSAASRSEIAR
jgi:AI-2 transport system permease protein